MPKRGIYNNYNTEKDKIRFQQQLNGSIRNVRSICIGQFCNRRLFISSADVSKIIERIPHMKQLRYVELMCCFENIEDAGRLFKRLRQCPQLRCLKIHSSMDDYAFSEFCDLVRHNETRSLHEILFSIDSRVEKRFLDYLVETVVACPNIQKVFTTSYLYEKYSVLIENEWRQKLKTFYCDLYSARNKRVVISTHPFGRFMPLMQAGTIWGPGRQSYCLKHDVFDALCEICEARRHERYLAFMKKNRQIV